MLRLVGALGEPQGYSVLSVDLDIVLFKNPLDGRFNPWMNRDLTFGPPSTMARCSTAASGSSAPQSGCPPRCLEAATASGCWFRCSLLMMTSSKHLSLHQSAVMHKRDLQYPSKLVSKRDVQKRATANGVFDRIDWMFAFADIEPKFWL